MLLFLLQTFFIPATLAHPIEIIDTEGKVLVKNNNTASWILAKRGTVLEKNSQLKTESPAECIISFDENLDNILALGRDTYLEIENAQPVKINLRNGSIFFLNDGLKQIEGFEIDIADGQIIKVTTTAAFINVNADTVTIKCFEDIAYLKMVDKKGISLGERNIEEGFGLKVTPKAVFSNPFELNDYDFADWEEFTNKVASLRAAKVNGKNIQF